jgi:hypothetical protein
LSGFGEAVFVFEQELALEEGYTVSFPFAEIVGEHTFYRVGYRNRAVAELLPAKQPQVAVRIRIVIAQLQENVVRNGVVVYFKCEEILRLLVPHLVLYGLNLVEYDAVAAREAKA